VGLHLVMTNNASVYVENMAELSVMFQDVSYHTVVHRTIERVRDTQESGLLRECRRSGQSVRKKERRGSDLYVLPELV